MSSAASFSVDSVDVDDAEFVARNDTALVKREPVLLFSLSLVHHALLDLSAARYDSVGFVLNGLLLFLGQRSVVSDI